MRSLVCLVVLAGCGGSAVQQPTAPPPSPDAPAPPPEATPTTLPGLDKTVCAQRGAEGYGPVPLTAGQMPLRRGTGIARFDQAPTTKDAPIEVCMPGEERAWLAAATCADGSQPTSADRAGNVGPGGACGSIIDLYKVVCPEKTYEVYMDMYMCPEGS